jgi:N-carbamoyl-L-amino-acid hydrolase
MYATIRKEADAIGKQNGTSFAYSELHVNVSAPTDPRMRKIITDAAASLKLSTRQMPSGAGHDAQAMAVIGPIGMIFVPSIGGISHAPKEFSRPEDIANGANVLLRSVLTADKALA